MDTWIKQNQHHWYFTIKKFTSMLDLQEYGTVADLLNLLKWSHQTSSTGVEELNNYVNIKSLLNMRQMDNETPTHFEQRVQMKSKLLVDKRLKYLVSPEMLTAIVYSGLNSHYSEPKAHLLNRQRPGQESLFPTNPGDLVDIVSTWVPSAGVSKGPTKTLAMTQFESNGAGTEKKGGKVPPTTPSNPTSPTTAQTSTISTSRFTITRKEKEARLQALLALQSYSQVPTPTTSPSRPCTACGHDHWGYQCNTLSDGEKLELYKKIAKGQINRMKVVQLTSKVVKSVIYDLEATTIDYSAGYDSLSEVHCCPLTLQHKLTNVTEAEQPIYLNQVHENFKCTHYGFHPSLNAPMWIAPVPTTIISHTVCRDSEQLLSYNSVDDVFTVVNSRSKAQLKFYPDKVTGLPKIENFCFVMKKKKKKKAYRTRERLNTYHLYSISRDIYDLNSIIRVLHR